MIMTVGVTQEPQRYPHRRKMLGFIAFTPIYAGSWPIYRDIVILILKNTRSQNGRGLTGHF